MKLSQVKSVLSGLQNLNFKLPNGEIVPSHFHVTEIGKISKHFIDCGGVERTEEIINFQLWTSNDYNHRLYPQKLWNIIDLSERRLNLSDLEIEVEYQSDTIGKFGLDFDGQNLLLINKQTDCLAKDKCGIPVKKKKISLSALQNNNCNSVQGNCC